MTMMPRETMTAMFMMNIQTMLSRGAPANAQPRRARRIVSPLITSVGPSAPDAEPSAKSLLPTVAHSLVFGVWYTDQHSLV